YVKTGKIAYYLRDLPLSSIHPNAQSTAAAARCAAEQGKYWEMHDTLFSKQDEWSSLSGDALTQKLMQYAADEGMNTQEFLSCYENSDFSAQISEDIADAQRYGIKGTPSSIIVLPKTANETKLIRILSANPEYTSKGILALAKDTEGNYVFFVKGAFPYSIFTSILES
ncbi:DsbA family protein, partial [Candidatus Micrarchaeota archaeon]|nr:DsbA family protein [Candidatus Micrarchaeota archaeon]